MTTISTYYKWQRIKSYFKRIPVFASVVRFIKWKYFWPIYAWLIGEKCTIVYLLKSIGIVRFSKNDEKLFQIKNTHKGEFAFIIGNGPSLRAEDLTMLKNKGVFCFAANRINLIFSDTVWRPNCYTAIDPDIYRNNDKTISNVLQADLDYYIVTKQIYSGFDAEFQSKQNCMYFTMKPISYYSNVREFSSDPVKYLMNGFTVTYLSMQLAYYMGFSKIYLLGVDCDYARVLNKSGKVSQYEGKVSYFSKNYDSTKNNSAYIDGMLLAYEYARKFAEQSGGRFSIYNASRGGKMKIFEQVEFDDIINSI